MGRAIAALAGMLGVLLAAAVVTGVPAAADAPSVVFVGPDPLAVHLTKTGDRYSATFRVGIHNAGNDNIVGTGYRFSVITDNVTDTKQPTLAPDPGVPLPAHQVTPVSLRLIVHDSATTQLTAVLSVTQKLGGKAVVEPSSVALAVSITPGGTNFWGIGFGSLGVGLVALALLGRTASERGKSQDPEVVWSSSTFDFPDSWATTVGALITALGAVLSTTGVLSSLIPGIDSGFFLGVTVFYGVVLALAPLVYSAMMRMPRSDGLPYGTRWGYAVAASLTAVAVGGQLATVGAIVSLSGLPPALKGFFFAVLGGSAICVLWYMQAGLRQLQALPEPTGGESAGDLKARVAGIA